MFYIFFMSTLSNNFFKEYTKKYISEIPEAKERKLAIEISKKEKRKKRKNIVIVSLYHEGTWKMWSYNLRLEIFGDK